MSNLVADCRVPSPGRRLGMRREEIPERKARSVVFGDFWGRHL